jgi:apolipoprotein N-acyltransferase
VRSAQGRAGLDIAVGALGVFVALAAAPPNACWPLGIVVWAPTAWLAFSGHVARATALASAQGAAVAWSLASGVSDALVRMDGTPPAVAIALVGGWAAYEGVRGGLVAFLASRGVRNGWPLLAAFPVAVVFAELVFPQLVPWTTCLFFHDAPILLQGAALGGPLVLSFGAALAAAGLVEATRRPGRLLVPATVLASAALGGAIHLRAVDRAIGAAPRLEVGLVQAGTTESSLEDGTPLDVYRARSRELAGRAHVDLFVWPEAADAAPLSSSEVAPALSGLEAPVLAGVLARETRAGVGALFNRAVVALPTGALAGAYEKRHLMTFGEYVPGAESLPPLRGWAPRLVAIAAGRELAPIAIGQDHLLVRICVEELLREDVREAVREADPGLLVGLSSDAWFGRGRVAALHSALAKLRAVEEGRFLVRATTTGLSAVFDPAGRVVASLPPNSAAATTASVRWLHERTLYARAGDAPFWALTPLPLVAALRRRRC